MPVEAGNTILFIVNISLKLLTPDAYVPAAAGLENFFLFFGNLRFRIK